MRFNRDTACLLAAITVAFVAGVFTHAGGAVWVVELVLTVAVIVAMAAGYWIGRCSINMDEDRAAIGRALERHRAGPVREHTAVEQSLAPLGGMVRHPIVTRPGDPEEDERRTPGPIDRPRGPGR